MRVGLTSDVHANATALSTVLSILDAAGCDAIWHMGDLVGYGPDPDEVVAMLKDRAARCVRGNHDSAASGGGGLDRFNPMAAAAASWTASVIAPATADFLASLPLVDQDDDVTLVHGSLRDPLWEYIDTFEAARGHFALQTTPLSIVGHTHLPLLLQCGEGGKVSAHTPSDGETFTLDGHSRWCINPGGVGQPRDGDNRASCAMLDLEARSVTYFRVPYDIAEAQERMRARGLAEAHVARLAYGR